MYQNKTESTACVMERTPWTQSDATTAVQPRVDAGDAVCARPFVEMDAHEWDELVQRSPNGTFLHSRRFLAYHGNRFCDSSVVFTAPNGAIIGVLPAALDPKDDRTVITHPGATYGGIVHDGTVHGSGMQRAIEGAVELFRLQGRRRFLYKTVPYIYHRSPTQSDVYWLHRIGATRSGCDLSATVDMGRRLAPTHMRSRSMRKACRATVVVLETPDFRRFWGLLESTLMDRHGVRPVHTIQEIELLASKFPAQIKCVIAEADGEVIAGSVLFVTDTVVHAQYYAASPRGRQLSGLDLVIEHCIELTGRLNCRYYDFGISTEERGRVLNEGLLRYKTSFGAGCCTYESYELALDRVGRSA
jgi:hypothetical protein